MRKQTKRGPKTNRPDLLKQLQFAESPTEETDGSKKMKSLTEQSLWVYMYIEWHSEPFTVIKNQITATKILNKSFWQELLNN